MDLLVPIAERSCTFFSGNLSCEWVFPGRLVKMGMDAKGVVGHVEILLLF